MTRPARAKYSPERRVRSTSVAFSRSVSAATWAGSMAVLAGMMVMRAIVYAPGVRLSRVSEGRAPDLAGRRPRQLHREVDDPRVLVRRRPRLHVLLQLARQRGRGFSARPEHDDGSDDASALVVGRRHDGRVRHGGMADERRLDL